MNAITSCCSLGHGGPRVFGESVEGSSNCAVARSAHMRCQPTLSRDAVQDLRPSDRLGSADDETRRCRRESGCSCGCGCSRCGCGCGGSGCGDGMLLRSCKQSNGLLLATPQLQVLDGAIAGHSRRHRRRPPLLLVLPGPGGVSTLRLERRLGAVGWNPVGKSDLPGPVLCELPLPHPMLVAPDHLRPLAQLLLKRTCRTDGPREHSFQRKSSHADRASASCSHRANSA